MLFALDDGGILSVVGTIEEARRDFESVDVESGDVRFFDAKGQALDPVFAHRDKRSLFGLQLTADPGPFDLQLSRSSPPPSLASCLGSVRFLEPNSLFADLAAVARHLESK
jgi:hypothetical protein